MKTLEQRVLMLEEEVLKLRQLLLDQNNDHRNWGAHHNNSCGKCGLNLSSCMGYVCNSVGCPTYNVITCKTQTGD